jgi:4-alpha-glucanotransferase
VFDAAEEALGALPVLAEDLGDIDQPVIDLRKTLGFPGMAVLQFAFEPAYSDNTHDPHHLTTDQVVYTGTHDNDTTVGWWQSLPDERRRLARESFARYDVHADPDAEPSWAMVELAHAMPCPLAMVQAQDVLGLGSQARMNAPGIEGGWSWQLEPGQLTAQHAARLRAVTEAAGRA